MNPVTSLSILNVMSWLGTTAAFQPPLSIHALNPAKSVLQPSPMIQRFPHDEHSNYQMNYFQQSPLQRIISHPRKASVRICSSSTSADATNNAETSKDSSPTRNIQTTQNQTTQNQLLDESPSSFYSSTNPQAGEDGYSLLRRPVTFDFEKDPTFDPPKALDEEEERRLGNVNALWYEEKLEKGRRNGQNKQSGILGDYSNLNTDGGDRDKNDSIPNTPNALHKGKQRQKEEDQTLTSFDMHRRTLDTLDYPLVLRALAEECGTVFGKELVLVSVNRSFGGGKRVARGGKNGARFNDKGTTITNGADGANGANGAKKELENLSYMPLTASDVQGVHRRYGAVQEMQRLMEGRIDGWVTFSRLMKDVDGNDNKNDRQKQSQKSQTKKKRSNIRQPLGAPPMQGHIFDIDPIFDIIDEGKVLEGPEILDVTTLLEKSVDVLDWTKALEEFNENNDDQTDENTQFSHLPQLTQSIDVPSELLSLLTNAFDSEGRLSSDTFPSLARLRAKIRTQKQSILETLDTILAQPSMRSKLATESGGALTMEINGRLVIPVQQSSSSTVGIVHDASRSGKTSYVEPTEIIAPTNVLRQTENELRAEEARIWRSLTEEIDRHRDTILQNVACLGQLDVVQARVRLGRRLNGIVPEVGEEGVVSVKEARHPVLLLRGLEEVVGSDVEIGVGENRGLILTGPNSGGKTVILKLLGLYAFMTRDGIPIPSQPQSSHSSDSPARVDFFSPILADIGDLQSVDGDLSTFSGHMLVCREVLNMVNGAAGDNSDFSPNNQSNTLTNNKSNALVLMDELGSGTDPSQGVAIAQSLLEALLDQNCRVAITTHYLELKNLASSDSRFAVAGMQFVDGRPTYKLIKGMIGESFALAVAERLKLPRGVIDRANELLDSDTRKMGELIQELEKRADDLKKQEYEMLTLKAEMKKQQEKLEQQQRNVRREEAKKFAQKLEEKEKMLEDILEKLKGSGASKKVVAESWSDIRIVKREVMSEAENVPGIFQRLQQQQGGGQSQDFELVPISEMKDAPPLAVGDKVVVCKKGPFHGKEGVVNSVGKKIQVGVGGVSVQLTTTEIAFPPTAFQSSKSKSSNSYNGQKMSKMARRAVEIEESADSAVDMSSTNTSRDSGSTMRTESNTVNCIGLNFEESKRKCLDMFSKAVLSNRSVVYILHGHGTGVLKNKIRTWLGNDRQWVKSFKGADQEDGGEALTRVELKKQNLF